jgi:hypothetical protein
MQRIFTPYALCVKSHASRLARVYAKGPELTTPVDGSVEPNHVSDQMKMSFSLPPAQCDRRGAVLT